MANTGKTRWLTIIALILLLCGYTCTYSLGEGKPLVLQEMSWTDVQDYLKTNDMVIIPLGATEQHGPHLPLGTDFYEAFAVSKMISARTGVVVAPVLLSGYSVYHSGFPGTLSLKLETMEQVLFETAEILIKYGFRRFMFFNHHGGNRVVEDKVMHRINHTTEATALRIGIYAPFQKNEKEPAPFDYHSGIGETSIMLYLKPELVKMERIKKPKMTFTPKMQEILELTEKNPELMSVLDTMMGTPQETKKGGASHELSSNGIWTMGDPKKATKEFGKKQVDQMVDSAVKFIEAWKQVKK
ncbi:MAG: creatininase family protein [Candidatus Aminicenantes bacterium]|nr:creatininase family protein [Candidatus Aminicenantes bacterium]NIM84473.1 creatininase family protein [Candidatus Aminicenantes bacterium]NIN23994.1 creatininase family protein [Candidatus Aminicenantes bacterium]NIN47708.1 creatininase family protein [Candidatus Aminicenantes bacterium]NIN90638.1 creatininase family protein [Candidatus Aminicenantes bacterium]